MSKKTTTKKPAQPNQSIERAIACLLELTCASQPLSCTEMAELLGVERTKASRMLGTLAFMGFAERLPDMRYIPGSGIHMLSAMSLNSSGLLQYALPHFERIRKERNLWGALGVLWRDKICYLYHSMHDEEGEHPIASHGMWPAVSSSIGKVILAPMPDSEISDLLKKQVDGKQWKTFMSDIQAIRTNGYYLEGTNSVAFTIGSPVIAGINFQGAWKKSQTPKLIAELQQIALQINEQLAAHKLPKQTGQQPAE